MRELLSASSLARYRAYLQANGIAPASVVRKISSVHKYAQWAREAGYLSQEEFNQVQVELQKFRGTVTGKSKLPHSKLKIPQNPLNLLRAMKEAIAGRMNAGIMGLFLLIAFSVAGGIAFYNQFFSRANVNLAYPTAPVSSSRKLNFQGLLTDSSETPITSPTNMRFRLYDASSGGSTLYDSGTCSIQPDTDGIVNVLVGSSCGAEIEVPVFTNYGEIWLGVTVGTDAEMTPRQQIANVPYAINSETLQGLPPGTGKSNIAYINDQGDLLISTSAAGIRSVWQSTTFQISSANAVTIVSAGSGDITLNATESGTIKLQTNGTTGNQVSATNANLSTGNLIYGSVNNDGTGFNLLQLQSGSSPTTKFQVDYAGNTTVAGSIYLPDGSASTPALTFTNDTNSGLYRIGNDKISLITGGTIGQGATVDPSGNVGIGSISPLQALDVNGDVKITGNDIMDSANTSRITLGDTTTLTNTTTTLSGTTTLTASSLATFTTAATLGMGSTTALNLGNNAVVTLGASTGGTVNGSSAADGDLTLQGTSNATRTNSYVILQPTAGNVGIGSATPLQVLDVNGDVKITGNDIMDSGNATRVTLGATTTLTNTTTTLSGTTTLTASSLATITTAATVNWGGVTTLNFTADNATINGSDIADGDLTLQGTSNATRDTSYVILQPTAGNVGIGSTTPTQRLDVVGNVAFSGALMPGGNAGISGYFLISQGAGSAPTWTNSITANALKWNALTDPDGNLALNMTTNTTTFNWDTGTGANDLFSLTSDNSANGTGALLNIQTGTTSTVLPLRVRAGATEALTVQADGNVGVGTTTSSQKLQVQGNARITGALYDSTNAAGSSGYFLSSTGTGTAWTNSITASALKWNALTDPDGNLALNMTTNTTTFNWDTGTGTSDLFNFTTDNSSNGTGSLVNIQTGTTSTVLPLRVRAGTAEALAVNSFGNVGIGTATPAYPLDVRATLSQARLAQFSGDRAGDQINTYFRHTSAGNLNNNLRLTFSLNTDTQERTAFEYITGFANITDASRTSYAYFQTVSNGSFGTKMAIVGSNVGIGTTAPTALLDINGVASSSATLTFRGTTDPKIDVLNGENLGIRTSVGGDTGLDEKVTILNSGNVGIGSATPLQVLDVNGDVKITGNDIMDSGNTSRITLGDTTTLTNTTTTLSGTTTLTASSLATFTTSATLAMNSTSTLNATSLATLSTAATLDWGGVTTVTFTADNATINGSDANDGDLTLQGTTSGTRTTSYVILQPTAGNVGIGSATPLQVLDVNGDVKITGNDIMDSGNATRVTLGATTTLTNTTTTLSGTTTLTASSLATFTTAAALSMGSTTTLTLGSNATINGGAAANDDLTLQGTSDVTRTTSYVILQPTAGNVGIGSATPLQVLDVNGDVKITGNDIMDSGNATRVTLGATTTLTNTTTTLSGTATLTASSLATFTTSATLAMNSTSTLNATSLANLTTAATFNWGGATSLTFTADNATINGSDIADGDLTLQGTSDATRDTSYVILQPTAGNVGIGSSTPGERLDVTGNVQFSGALMPGGSAGNSGEFLISQGAGAAPIWTNSIVATSVKWNSIINPDGNLSLTMGTNLTTFNWATGTSTNDLFSLTTDASADGTGSLLNIQTGAGSTVLPLRVRAGATEALAVDANGNVGVGTTGNSIAKLQVAGNIHLSGANPSTISTSSIMRLDIDSNANSAADYLDITHDAGTSLVRILEDGNVGIGTTSPSQLLHVYDNVDGAGVDNTMIVERFDPNTPATDFGNAISFKLGRGDISVSTESGRITTYTTDIAARNYNMDFVTTSGGSATTKMTIKDNGNVGIGSTNPGAKFDVNGALALSGTDNIILNGNWLSNDGGDEGVHVGNDGNVGIGTATASQLLHVQGNLRVTGAFYDSTNAAGPSGHILSSTGTGTAWVEAAGIGIRWSSIIAPTANLTLGMSTYTTAFSWQTGTGTNDLFSLTTDASANGTGALLNLQTGAGATVLPLRVRAGTTEALMVDRNGNVGIGTTSPYAPLEVRANSSGLGLINSPSVNGDSVARLMRSSTTDFATFEFANGTSASPTAKWGIGLRETSDDFLHFYSHVLGTDTLVINNTNGNVGINTTNPLAKLHIDGSTATMRITDGGSLRVIAGDDAGLGGFYNAYNDAGSQTVAIRGVGFSYLSGGNVGIGSVTPLQVLDVNGDVKVTGNDLMDSGNTSRITLGATTTLTNTTTTLSGTTSLTASSLTTFTTAAALNWAGATTVTFTADNATINGSDADNGNLTLQGTSSAVRTTSYVVIQPTAGNVGIGSATPGTRLDVTGDIRSSQTIFGSGILQLGTTGTIGGWEYKDLATDYIESYHGLRVYTSDRLVADAGLTVGYNVSTVPVDSGGAIISGNVGIGTATAVNNRLTLYGTASNAAGPHWRAVTSTDIYPVYSQLNWSHDNIGLNFDSYYDAGWKSSDPGSNFQIYKISDALNFNYESGIAAGATATFATAFSISANGSITIGDGLGTVAINSNDWDITTAGVATGFNSITSTTFVGALTGNASTASALAANPANCAAASFPLGIAANGSVESCSTSISGNAATATTATNANNVALTAASANANYLPTLSDTATGNQNIYTDANFTFNPSTNTLTTGTFSGALNGNATTATTATTATNANNVNLTNATANASYYVTLSDVATGNQTIFSDATLRFNPSTNVLSNTTFSGALSGNASTASGLAANPANCAAASFPLGIAANGSVETCSTSISGNAATATTATNANNVNLTNATANGYYYVTLSDVATGNQTMFSDSVLRYNPSSNALGVNTASVTAGYNMQVGGDVYIDYGSSQNIRFTTPGGLPGFGLFNGANPRADYKMSTTALQIGVRIDGQIPDVGMQLGNRATSWGTWSDERLKTIQAPIENATDKLAGLRTVYFNYKMDPSDSQRRIGLIAQDVQAVFPEAVFTDDNGYLVLQYTDLIPPIISALKEQDAKIDAQGDLVIQGQSSSTYTVRNTTQNKTITTILAGARAVIASITAGTIHTKELAADSITVGSQTLNQYVRSVIAQVQSEQSASSTPITVVQIPTNTPIQTPKLETKEVQISDSGGSSDSANITVEKENAFAQLVIKIKNNTIARIDQSGNATFSGTLDAPLVKTDSLDTKNASVSGTLVAKEIRADNIQALTAQVNTLQSQLAHIGDTPLPLPSGYMSAQALVAENLTVTNLANVYDLSVAHAAIISHITIDGNNIGALAQNITFFNGELAIAQDGSLTTQGSVMALGGIKTDVIEPATPHGNVTVKLNDEASSFKIQNNDKDVASIDASGSAYFAQGVDFDKYEASAGAIIAAPQAWIEFGENTPAIKTNSQASGDAILPAGESEILIANTKVKANSLVYVTATTSTNNQIIYVSAKKEGAWFKVKIDQPISQDITFNWWVL